MSLTKSPIYARTLAEARAYNLSALLLGAVEGQEPPEYHYQLTFEDVHGLTAVKDREVLVTMTGGELASAIGAIPALAVEDPEDMKALARVQNLLRTARPK